jgi:hypothetical protein
MNTASGEESYDPALIILLDYLTILFGSPRIPEKS